jgi:hypothetical protein
LSLHHFTYLSMWKREAAGISKSLEKRKFLILKITLYLG